METLSQSLSSFYCFFASLSSLSYSSLFRRWTKQIAYDQSKPIKQRLINDQKRSEKKTQKNPNSCTSVVRLRSKSAIGMLHRFGEREDSEPDQLKNESVISTYLHWRRASFVFLETGSYSNLVAPA
ncbi:hypothetical protein EV1_029544 [Malus domestica]